MSNELPPSISHNTNAEFGARVDFPSQDFEAAVLRFAGSGLFERVFKEGMDLVEETAAYLDGPGREDAKVLARADALAYAGESMRLTTRLMQVASWLLVQRAIAEAEMTPYEALDEKYRLGAKEVCRSRSLEGFSALPEKLRELLITSERIYEQVSRLDQSLYQPKREENTFNSQLDRLHEMFGDASPQDNLG